MCYMHGKYEGKYYTVFTRLKFLGEKSKKYPS
jgi:hypothetical protein